MENNNKHKIGIMGGTFDPIHIGHLILAQAAFEVLGLEKVIFIPAGNPPHKRNRKIKASNEQRVEMVRLAIEGDDRFVLDTREVIKEDLSYTFATMRDMSRENPENDYYFIIGGDSLRDYHTWMKPEEIVKYCHIAATGRPGVEEELDALIKQRTEEYGGDFIKVMVPMIEISASDIRSRIENGKAFRYMIPEKVYEYICENRIYL